jgi:hypothetical protein
MNKLKANQGKRINRITAVIMLVICFILILTGCMGGEDYASYLNAIKKTEDIQSGVDKVEVVVQSTFNEALLQKVDKEDADAFRQLGLVKVTLEERFNHTDNQSIYDVFYYSNTLGMDFKVFMKGPSEIFLKLPFMSDVYAIGETFEGFSEEPEALTTFFKGVGLSWSSMLKAENIFIGEKTIITNDDGEVKATKFSVKPTSAQLDSFLRQLREEILANKGTLFTYLKDMQYTDGEEVMTESDFETIVEAIFNSMAITRYEETAYVDLDGYIIDEMVTIELKYATSETFNNLFDTQTISIHTTRWDIERAQKLDFSILETAEIKPIENLNEWSVTP